jgi:hypothetical protein
MDKTSALTHSYCKPQERLRKMISEKMERHEKEKKCLYRSYISNLKYIALIIYKQEVKYKHRMKE